MMDWFGQAVWGDVPSVGANQLVLEAVLEDLPTALTHFFSLMSHSTFVRPSLSHA